MHLMRLFVVVLSAALLPMGQLRATDSPPPSWEIQALGSDFIGIVECITAGGIVARYKVIESWKGVEAGNEFNLREELDYWGGEFPIALCGERFLAFSAKSVQSRAASVTISGGVPLWWRNLPTDYQVWSAIPLKEFIRAHAYFADSAEARLTEIMAFKSAVEGFLRAPSGEQELRVMLSVARRNLYLPSAHDRSDAGNSDDIALYETLSKATNVDALWDQIADQLTKLAVPAIPNTGGRPRAEYHKKALLQMIEGGGAQTRATFEKASRSRLPWESTAEWKDRERVENSRRSLTAKYVASSPKVEAQPPETVPDKNRIEEAKAQLGKPWDRKSEDAFFLLAKHSPESVATFLMDWLPSEDWQVGQFGYVLGSAFGHECNADRIALLSRLCSAKDEWIRTAAAVYLCFDDPKLGMGNLRSLMSVPGDPGAWAALVLASRGDKAAMPRALEVMATPKNPRIDSVNHRNLQKRLRVLLSNTAKVSGMAPPPAPSKEYAEGRELELVQLELHSSLLKWWKENQAKVALRDPWLATLEKDKVD